MPRPVITGHDGFLVPNASAAVNPRMAEPDQVDFNIVAHGLWGVIEGCLVTVSGSTAIIQEGLAVVNGNLVTVASGQIVVGTGSGQDRFDLICVDAGGTPQIKIGTASLDPVFPSDVPADMTVLAAVFIPAGATSLADNVIDKRRFVQRKLLAKLPSGADLIRNVNGNGDYYRVNGEGETTWNGDTIVSRYGVATLRVQRNLKVDDSITAGGEISAARLRATGLATSSNLRWGGSLDPTAAVGTLHQGTTLGKLWIMTTEGWKEIATQEGAVPLGAVLQSIQPPSYMQPKGWICFDGRTVLETQWPSLFDIATLTYLHTGNAPNRSMDLPDLTDRVLMTKRSGVGRFGPANRESLNRISLAVSQMPKHNHNTRTQNASGGRIEIETKWEPGHEHATWGGKHTHPVKDPGHNHNGVDLNGTPQLIIAKVAGGKNSLDALFNDNNHTHTVTPLQFLSKGYTNITIGDYDSGHGHEMATNGGHKHDVVIKNPELVHDHPVLEDDRGSGADIDITPSYFAVFTYVRS